MELDVGAGNDVAGPRALVLPPLVDLHEVLELVLRLEHVHWLDRTLELFALMDKSAVAVNDGNDGALLGRGAEKLGKIALLESLLLHFSEHSLEGGVA